MKYSNYLSVMILQRAKTWASLDLVGEVHPMEQLISSCNLIQLKKNNEEKKK